MQKWEYTILKVDLKGDIWNHPEKFQALGAEGWELVCSVTDCSGNTNSWATLIFKRPKQ